MPDKTDPLQGSGTIHISYNQYELSSPGTARSDPWPDSPDGLLTGEADWLAVICGTDTGIIGFHLDVTAGPPGQLGDEDWEMIAERDLMLRTPVVAAWNMTNAITSPRFDVGEPGLYRVRVHVRCRAEGVRAFVVTDIPVEHHLVLMWPSAQPTPSTVVHGPDSVALVRREG